MRALVLSGGSSKAAYQVGVLKYLINELNVKYDVFAGVSAGALNCAFLSQFTDDTIKDGINQLYNIWAKLDNSKIYKDWKYFGKVAVLWKNSFYDSSPLQKLITSNIDLNKIRTSGKKIVVGSVSLTSGKYTLFDQDNDHLINAITSSASFPIMFSPISFLEQHWIDGGIKEYSPLKAAIELGATEIDLIMTSPQTRDKKFLHKPNVLDILNRTFDLSTDKISSNDLEKAELYNKLALAGFTDKKYVKLQIIRPEFNLIEDLLDFRPHKIKEMMDIGYNDVKNKYIKYVLPIL